ncbi:MAG TPA: hypothetical protein VMI06_04435 [Terriglobia bacterium]|nr:hypothetical protein [Terriglobia bacterium]
MKFIKPSRWITPPGQAACDDCCPPLAFLGRVIQAATYPVAAAVSGVGALATALKGKRVKR